MSDKEANQAAGEAQNPKFIFEISLSVLNHLGRNLYRSFATVLGEAISNAWDADANKVEIYLDEDKNGFWIKDDGVGMTAEDFQEKFLRIGYSKRHSGKSHSAKKRPFIGRKGIGKLALLSCADKITVVTKTKETEYTGGTIDNRGLDKAIKKELTPDKYPLADVNLAEFQKFTKGHSQGTIIRFENLKDGVRRSFEFLSKVIALYFRFSLLDDNFKIYLNGKQITHASLKDLAETTEFLWKINTCFDPYLEMLEKHFSKNPKDHEVERIKLPNVTGFIASVEKPTQLKILTTDERIGIDLFVNGRLRESDILKHIPTARIPESYLYGQIHFNSLDDKVDRFTSSREGIIADDPKYQAFLTNLRKVILKIVEQWDEWRTKHREEGDSENKRLTKSQRASLGLYGAVSKGFEPAKGKSTDKVEQWMNELGSDAVYNFESYAECFVSENLVRKLIKDRKVKLSTEAVQEATKWKGKESENKNKGNISIEIRKGKNDLSYLSMDGLANLVDKRDPIKEACLSRDAAQFKPIRDAVAHTALLTDEAKAKLSTVRANIKARVKTLLSSKK